MRTSFVALAIVLGLVFQAQAGMTGSGTITPENYPDFAGYVNNPPKCGMPYKSLDLNRVTAVQSGLECNGCIEVCGTKGCINVLAIDQGGRGLDLSTGAFQKIFGQKTDPANARWKKVDASKCKGIRK